MKTKIILWKPCSGISRCVQSKSLKNTKTAFFSGTFIFSLTNIYDQILAKMINTRFVRNVCFATTLTPNSFKFKNIDKLFSSCLNTLYNLKKMADNVCKMKPVVMRRNMHNKIICSTSVILELVLYHFYTFIEIMLQNITSLKLSKYFNSKLGNCRKNFELFLN